jgi:hypothetical protein
MDPTRVTPLFNVPFDTQVNSQPASSASQFMQKGSTPSTQQKYVEKDKKHTGVAGVARDIFGTLGDFLLTKLGVGPMYAPAQRQRKLAIAQEGFEQDPIGAINRVSSIDAVMGSKMREQFIDNQRIAAQNAATNEDRDARIELARKAANDKTEGIAAAMLGSMHDWDENKRKQDYPAMRAQVIANAKRKGLDLSADLPEEFDEASLDAFISGAVPVGTQQARRLTKERNEALEELGKDRISVTREGQQIVSKDKAANRAVTKELGEKRIETTKRGQDITSADRRRGQNITSADRRRGQDISASKPRDGDVRRGQDGKNYVRKSGKWYPQK